MSIYTGKDYKRIGTKKADRVLAERILGKNLSSEIVVHHVNGGKDGPIVICPNRAYHNLIHARMRALKVCGHPDWRKCVFCKQYDSPDKLKFRGGNGHGCYHRECNAKYEIKRRQER